MRFLHGLKLGLTPLLVWPKCGLMRVAFGPFEAIFDHDLSLVNECVVFVLSRLNTWHMFPFRATASKKQQAQPIGQ